MHPLAYGAPGTAILRRHLFSASGPPQQPHYILKKHLDMTKIYSSAASYNLHASSVSRKQVDLQLDSTFRCPL